MISEKSAEILKRRAGRVYTAEEAEQIKRSENQRASVYRQLDPILADFYKLRVILRTRKHTLTEQIQFRKLKEKRDKLTAILDGLKAVSNQ